MAGLWMSVCMLLFGGFASANESSDVVARATIPTGPEAAFAVLSGLEGHRAIWPANCATDWEMGNKTRGPGAAATLRWVPGPMRRKLTGVLVRLDSPSVRADGARLQGRVDLDHEGRKGFTMTWTLIPTAAGTTDVEVHTWINPPPFPARRAYSRKVQPEWQACHERAIQNLADLASRGGSPGGP